MGNKVNARNPKIQGEMKRKPDFISRRAIDDILRIEATEEDNFGRFDNSSSMGYSLFELILSWTGQPRLTRPIILQLHFIRYRAR
jgi:hypothetical protein